MQETITISLEEYEELLEDSKFLKALRAAGVDNWDGYDCARSIAREGENENEEDN